MFSSHPCPKRNGSAGNYCAYCHYWEGDSQLQSGGAGAVKFESSVRGLCVYKGRRSPRLAANVACRDFELSNNASRYAK